MSVWWHHGEIWRETLRRTLPSVCNVTTFSERDPVVVIWCSCFQIISPYSGKFSFLNSLHNALFIRFSSAIINFFTACILFHHNYQTHKYIICPWQQQRERSESCFQILVAKSIQLMTRRSYSTSGQTSEGIRKSNLVFLNIMLLFDFLNGLVVLAESTFFTPHLLINTWWNTY